MKTFEKIAEMYEAGELSDNQVTKLVAFYEGLVKQANAARGASIGARLFEGALLATGIGASNVLLNKAVSKYDENKQVGARESGFQQMLNMNPSLRQENIEQVYNIYNTLARFAPSLAMDPYAASGYVKRVLQFDPESGTDYNVIRTLVQLEKDHQDARSRRIAPITDSIGAVTTAYAKPGVEGIMRDTGIDSNYRLPETIDP